MKLKHIMETMDVDPSGAAQLLILFNKLKNTPSFISAVEQLKMPVDKYNAILKFAELLGIPEDKFESFTVNLKNIRNKEFTQNNF